MSFLKRVSDAASAGVARAGEVASHATEAVTEPAKGGSLRETLAAAGERAKGGLDKAGVALADPANQATAAAKVRAAGGKAKAGLSGAVDRIDPDLFAEVIKATSVQERINGRLIEKKSPYRVADIEIAVAFPLPTITFTISRLTDPAVAADAAATEALAAEIVAADMAEAGLATDGQA